MDLGQLDHEAIDIWGQTPGVEYVICVKFESDFTHAEYKVYDTRVRPLVPLPPLPIEAPEMVIHLDGHRVLRIPEENPLPEGFPHELAVDLYTPLINAQD